MGGTWLGLMTVIAAGAPAALAAWFAYLGKKATQAVGSQLITGNEKTVGEMLTEVHGKESVQDTDFETHAET